MCKNTAQRYFNSQGRRYWFGIVYAVFFDERNGNPVIQPRKDRSIERLSKLLEEIPSLKQRETYSPQFEKWHRDTEVAISRTFLDRPGYLQDFRNVRYRPSVFTGGGDYEFDQAFVQGLDKAASILESMIDEIREYWKDDEFLLTPPEIVISERETTNEVFVVHGRDDGAKETVARFLSKLGLQPVILHERANQGRTIIEKFEEHAQVGYAVILLTPDDMCSSPDQPGCSRPRARQNVILELGFFLGMLGRQRTFALKKGNVETPSDYDGVLYIPLDDSGAWRLELVREFKGAGLAVDANLAL